VLWYADDDSDAPLAVVQRRITRRVVHIEQHANQLDALVLDFYCEGCECVRNVVVSFGAGLEKFHAPRVGKVLPDVGF
jgi:hypothetical protein